jgi:hypothetical protein
MTISQHIGRHDTATQNFNFFAHPQKILKLFFADPHFSTSCFLPRIRQTQKKQEELKFTHPPLVLKKIVLKIITVIL